MKLFLMLSIFFCISTSSAATIYVYPAEAEGVEAYMKTTVDHLVKSFVTRESHTLSNNADSAEMTLSPKVMKLGNAYFLSVDKKKGGKVIFSSSMKAANAEDLDTVAKRVVRSVLNEQKIEDSATVEDVTAQEETQNTRRYQATRQWRFLFGPSWGSNLNFASDSLGTSFFNFGYAWGMDPHYDLTVDWKQSTTSNSGYYGAFILAMTYYPNLGKHSPYFRAGFGKAYGAAGKENAFILSDDSFSGWGAEIGVGYKFFRTSSVNVVIELNYDTAFAKTSQTDKTPGLTTLGFGVYY